MTINIIASYFISNFIMHIVCLCFMRKYIVWNVSLYLFIIFFWWSPRYICFWGQIQIFKGRNGHFLCKICMQCHFHDGYIGNQKNVLSTKYQIFIQILMYNSIILKLWHQTKGGLDLKSSYLGGTLIYLYIRIFFKW